MNSKFNYKQMKYFKPNRKKKIMNFNNNKINNNKFKIKIKKYFSQMKMKKKFLLKILLFSHKNKLIIVIN